MSLTRNEIIRLLATVAVLDDVDVDDPLTISAWYDMAVEGRWESFDAARRALLVYRTEHPDYRVKPGHITQVLERVRAQAARTFDPSSERLPQAAADDPERYREWITAQAAAHNARAIAGFVGGDASGRRALESRPQ